MADLATQDDVESLWRALTGDEIDQVEAMLRYASAILRARVPSVDARIDDGTLDPQVVTDVVASMVIRALRNPTGITQESIGPVSYSISTKVGSGYLFLTDDELYLLSPAGLPGTARGFGTIHLHAGIG